MGITIFNVVENMTIKIISKKLHVKPIENIETSPEGESVTLKTTIDDIKVKDNYVGGIVKQDYLDKWYDREGKQKSIQKVRITPFTFRKGSLNLFVHDSFQPASKVAHLLSNIVFKDKNDPILTRKIHPNKLVNFLEHHNCIIKGCSWKDLDLPKLSTAHIVGKSIDGTRDFERYDKHGTRNNVFFNMPSEDITLSVSQTATVSIRNKMETNNQEQFILDNIIPLCM